MDNFLIDETDNNTIRNEIVRYISFWPYFLILSSVFIISSYIYLRYTTYTYKSQAVIEIIDEAQNSEMALPTELTVFNRSMINLENEINILNSYSLNSEVVKSLKYNVLFYRLGNIKKPLVSRDIWYNDYQLNFKVNTDEIKSKSSYMIESDNGSLKIDSFDSNDELIESFTFNSLSTIGKTHELPFELIIKADKNLSVTRQLVLLPLESEVNRYRSQIKINELGKGSDQLSLSIVHENPKIAEKYLNTLMSVFDNDGISDRQLEYARTIEFVNEREKILKKDLEIIELRKQNYKQENNLSDINIAANNNIDLKYSYNSEIFQIESQKEIVNYLLESISNPEFDYLPLNIGIDNFELNNLIIDYNKIVSERNKYNDEAGSNNILVKSLQAQLENLVKNISTSLKNLLKSIDIKLNNLKLKEFEFDSEYNKVPENEKTLRAIERELSIKEALYLLLLQKREEASINLAVIKPSIKIIDYPITDKNSKSPKPMLIYLGSIVISVFIYVAVLYIWFFMDNKIHNKEQLSKKLINEIPILCEIPYIRQNLIPVYTDKKDVDFSRMSLTESIRMLIANLKFINSINDNNTYCKTLMFTSSVKGEGKTLASVNTAINLSNDSKMRVLLIGADLRNPQIHKSFDLDKNIKGLSDILYKNDSNNYTEYIKKYKSLDIIFSGTIPPNPTALLTNSFEKLLNVVKENYDYVIIDTAPCLLVSDTFELIKHVDSVIYLFRANQTDKKLIEYINEHYTTGRIKNLSVVLNGVGNSSSYGYRYGYQYGYKYGYNYGYGYGYSESS